MAATDAGRQLTKAFQSSQSQLAEETVRRLLVAWRLIDPYDLSRTVPQWLAVAEPVVALQHRASVALGAGYVRAFRAAELGSVGSLRVVSAEFAAEAVRESLISTGPASLKRATARGVPPADAATKAAAKSSASGMRHVLDGGRNTVLNTVSRDPAALGWARALSSANPCSFCAMLASRGPVYRSEDSSGFQPHDNCHCEPEPVYQQDSPWPDGSSELADLYRDAAAGESDPLNAFRRAYEGRPG